MDIFQIVVGPYVKLQDRLAIMEDMRRNNQMSHVGLNRLKKIAIQLKNSIANLFMVSSKQHFTIFSEILQTTPWLRETDEFGLDLLSEFLTTLEEITIVTDFDELDVNLTKWRRINRFVTSKYFEYSKRSVKKSTKQIYLFNRLGQQDVLISMSFIRFSL